MKKRLMFPLIFFGLIIGQSSAQSRLKLEMYTGPQYGYQKLLNDTRPSIDFQTNVANHLGLGFLYGVNSDWQLVVQSEFTGLAYSYNFYPNFPDVGDARRFQVRGGQLWNHRIGLRKTWEKGNYAFFVQPSVGITMNRYAELNEADTLGGFNFFTYRTSTVGSLALETGVKFYTKNKNYFTIGLRHQQGFGVLNPKDFNWVNNVPVSIIQRRGSYTGLVLGYGIDFKGKAQETKDAWKSGREERKNEKRAAAWGNGAYLGVTGFLRFRPKIERLPNLQFSNIYGGNEILAGYTFGSLSIESGYGRMSAYTRATIGNGTDLGDFSTSYSVGMIPLRLRYHYDLGNQNKFRIGVSSAALYTLETHYLGRSSIGFTTGNSDFEGTLIRINPLEQQSKGKVFFNGGIFTEISIFNSSMLTFNVSKNFGSPDVGLVNFSGQFKGEPVDLNASGSLNGWIMELGYKLPLKSIFK